MNWMVYAVPLGAGYFAMGVCLTLFRLYGTFADAYWRAEMTDTLHAVRRHPRWHPAVGLLLAVLLAVAMLVFLVVLWPVPLLFSKALGLER